MGKIRTLPVSVINRIAAGEVVDDLHEIQKALHVLGRHVDEEVVGVEPIMVAVADDLDDASHGVSTGRGAHSFPYS